MINTMKTLTGGRVRIYARAFGGLLARDTRVLRRDFVPFLLRTVMNPIMFTFVFAFVFPKIGEGFHSGGSENFATILLPGLVAVAMIFQGIAAVALPLVNEFGRTREIEDRIMAPLPVSGVALEKIAFGAIQSVVAALVVFPVVSVIPATPVAVHVANWPLLVIGTHTRESDLRGLRSGDRDALPSPAGTSYLLHHRNPGDIFGLRVLSLATVDTPAGS